MSTLTSHSHSPSPAASPRSSFHVQRSAFPPAPSSTSSKVSPRSPWPTAPVSSPSPRRAFHAPAFASPLLGSRLPREHYIESPPVQKAPRFVDAGTQYSPDGYPPTAGRTIKTATGQQRPGVVTPSSAGKKRKEREDGPLDVSPMSTSGNSSSGPGPVSTEPDARTDPSPQQSAPVAGPSTRPEPEPEEARSTLGHSSTPKRSKSEPGASKAMPALYQNCNPKDLGNLISNMLMELIRLNDRIPLRDGRLTRFHSRAPPGISVSDYLQRLIHHATLSPPILLSMVWYIDRLCQLYPAFTINSLTVHRFLITAATVAAKGLSDSFWTNPVYARIGGIPVTELATLELEFLQKVQWKIVPKPEALEDYYRSLVERTEGYELESVSESTSVDSSENGDEKDGEVEDKGVDGDQDMPDEPT